MASTVPPMNAFHPADSKVKSSDASSKFPLMMPQVSLEPTELDPETDEETTEAEDVGEAEDELGVIEDEGTSPQATRNNAVKVEKTTKFFLFI